MLMNASVVKVNASQTPNASIIQEAMTANAKKVLSDMD